MPGTHGVDQAGCCIIIQRLDSSPKCALLVERVHSLAGAPNDRGCGEKGQTQNEPPCID